MDTALRKINFNGAWKLPLLPDYIMRWADITPDNDCIVFADTGRVISFQEFDELTGCRFAKPLVWRHSQPA